MFCRERAVAQAMWGVMRVLGVCSRGLSAAGGSLASTSTPRPPSLPLCRASATAASSSRGPRAVLMRMAPGFMRARALALMMARVASVSGQCREMTSACWKIWSVEAKANGL